MIFARLSSLWVLALTLPLAVPAHADDRATPLADVLELDASVSTEVAPDLAVVTLAIVREGADVAPLTSDVNQVLSRAFADAKSVAGVTVANGGYSTTPRYENRGSTSVRTGWQVRGEIVLKSKDFAALGGLAGRLGQTMQISGTGFEISPELRAQTEAGLIERGARAFQDKALASTRAFGYAGYAIRQVTLGSVGQSGGDLLMRPMAMKAMSSGPVAPLPVESGRVTLSLSVNGSLQMRH